jgi:DNA-binding NarL/FixJ family response regulator
MEMCKKTVVVATNSLWLGRHVIDRVKEHGADCVLYAANEAELWETIEEDEPDLVMLDSRNTGSASHLLIYNLHTKFPNLRLAMFSFEAMTVEQGARYRLFGASGCLNFRYDEDAWGKGIKALLEGKDYITKELLEVMDKVYDDIRKRDFTMQEIEVYTHILHGYTNEVTARLLKCSVNTVRAHKRSIFKKCGVNSDIQLLRFAIDRGDVKRLDWFDQPGYKPWEQGTVSSVQ